MTARARPPPSAPVTRPEDSALTAAAHPISYVNIDIRVDIGILSTFSYRSTLTCTSKEGEEQGTNELSRDMLLELFLYDGIRELPAPFTRIELNGSL
jgi:hypothetical protein